jgi:hypothetical protein
MMPRPSGGGKAQSSPGPRGLSTDEIRDGTEHLACGASVLHEDGTHITHTLLLDHPSGHTDTPGPSIVEG